MQRKQANFRAWSGTVFLKIVAQAQSMAASQVERTLSEVAISSYSSGIPKFASQETAGNHVRWELGIWGNGQ